ncbi:MAG: LTA synthase family protein, partial [Bacteroidales bacterium]
TVMNMLGSKPYISFGNDMLSGNQHFVFNYKNGVYLLMEEGYLLQFDGQRTVGLYHIVQDEMMKHNLVNTNLETKLRMENRIKALIQDYTERLIDNKLTVID